MGLWNFLLYYFQSYTYIGGKDKEKHGIIETNTLVHSKMDIVGELFRGGV